MWRKHVAIPQEVEISAMLTLGLAHKPANKLFDKQLIREDRREENEIREALDINAGAYDADRRDDDLDFPVFEILAGLRVIFSCPVTRPALSPLASRASLILVAGSTYRETIRTRELAERRRMSCVIVIACLRRSASS